MHARGETGDTKTTWSEAFRYRRGFTWAYTFNDDGTPTGKTWTRQWTIKRKDGKPLIIGVIYDVFDVGRGAEVEFVQVTTQPNEFIAKIAERMLLLLNEEDLELWLGGRRAPLEDVKNLVKTHEFNPAEWTSRLRIPMRSRRDLGSQSRKPKADLIRKATYSKGGTPAAQFAAATSGWQALI